MGELRCFCWDKVVVQSAMLWLWLLVKFQVAGWLETSLLAMRHITGDIIAKSGDFITGKRCDIKDIRGETVAVKLDGYFPTTYGVFFLNGEPITFTAHTFRDSFYCHIKLNPAVVSRPILHRYICSYKISPSYICPPHCLHRLHPDSEDLFSHHSGHLLGLSGHPNGASLDAC